jgi:hypothetical protein
MGYAIFIGAVLAGLASGGACMGMFIGAILGIIPAAAADAIWRHARRAGQIESRRRRWLLSTAGFVVSAVVVAFVLRPPSGLALLHEHLGLEPSEVRNVRRWASMGRDPSFGVRFHVEEPTLLRGIAVLGALPAAEPNAPESPRDAAEAALVREMALLEQKRDQTQWAAGGFLPTGWWQPAKRPGVRTWEREGTEPAVYVRYDPNDDTAYLLVVYH